MTDISVGGQPIVLKFWQSVLLMQRYNLCIEHNFVRLTDFLIQSSKLWNDQKYCSKRGLHRGGLEHVMNFHCSRLISIFQFWVKKKNHDFHEIFGFEALDHYKTSSKKCLLEVVAMETVTNCFWFKSTSSRYKGIFHMLITRQLKSWFRRNFQDGSTPPL